MGKSYKLAYRVEYRDNDRKHAPDTFRRWEGVTHPTKVMGWQVKDKGAPNKENLEKWRVAMNDGFNRGGVNYHVSLSAGVLVHISHARIIRQSDGEIMADVTMPMFEVI